MPCEKFDMRRLRLLVHKDTTSCWMTGEKSLGSGDAWEKLQLIAS